MNDNTLKRIWVSKGGAFAMFIVYVIVMLGLSFFKISYYNLNTMLQYLLVPGAILVSVTPTTESSLLGIPFLALFVSLIIYMAIGYTFDWFYKPNK